MPGHKMLLPNKSLEIITLLTINKVSPTLARKITGSTSEQNSKPLKHYLYYNKSYIQI